MDNEEKNTVTDIFDNARKELSLPTDASPIDIAQAYYTRTRDNPSNKTLAKSYHNYCSSLEFAKALHTSPQRPFSAHFIRPSTSLEKTPAPTALRLEHCYTIQ